ncbi:MAG TPA: pyridoxal phosphate-dependent aminotransferase [Clostridia bacterium]
MALAKRTAQISSSLTLAITAMAKKMKAEGIDVVGFGAGEPDFNTPEYIIEAAKEALDKGFTKYTANSGMPQLKEAICQKFLRDNGLKYEPSQIIVSNGAKHSLYNAMLALVDQGDEVIIPAPYWLTYPELVKMCDGTPVIVDTQEDGFKLTPEKLKKAITPKTKAIIINSPSNPSGVVYTKEELWALAEVLENTDIYVISDEIYEKLIYDGYKHYSIASYSPKLYKQTIVVNGVSKTYSMTGWRVGYLAADKEIVQAIDKMQSHSTSNACSISQYATVRALNAESSEFLEKMLKTFDERRKLIVDFVNSSPYLWCPEPKGAFYVMVNISKIFGKSIDGQVINSAQRAAELMLQYAKVAVVPCESFGAPEFIRLSYATSKEEIQKGLQRLQEFLEKVE